MTAALGGADGGALTPVVVVAAVGAVFYVWTAVALAAVFDKSGAAPWRAWVPLYNLSVLLRLGGLSGWLVLLLLLPVFGVLFVWAAVTTAAHRIGTEFGYRAGMTALAAVMLPAWASVIGFGPAAPLPPRAEPEPPAPRDDESWRELSPDFGWSVFDRPALRTPEPALSPEAARFSEPPRTPEPAAAAEPPAAARQPAPDDRPNDTAPITSWWMPAEPGMPAASPPAEPVRRTRMLREPYLPEGEGFPEESGEVSAVVGAPIAGAPRAASAGVSAFRPAPPDDLDDDVRDDDTMIAARRRPRWAVELPDGSEVELTADAVVLGRRPAAPGEAPGAQLVGIADATRTVSKTHALLRRHGETWTIADLDSTNGVVVVDGAGVERELAPGASLALESLFLLGDAQLRMRRRDV